MMNEFELNDMSASLYDGGWRAEDREEMIAEYDLTDDEVDQICNNFAEYAANEKMKELLNTLDITLITNRSMTTDEILDYLGCTVDEEGEILSESGKPTGIWYEEIEY